MSDDGSFRKQKAPEHDYGIEQAYNNANQVAYMLWWNKCGNHYLQSPAFTKGLKFFFKSPML